MIEKINDAKRKLLKLPIDFQTCDINRWFFFCINYTNAINFFSEPNQIIVVCFFFALNVVNLSQCWKKNTLLCDQL